MVFPCLPSVPKPLLPVLSQVVCARCSDYRVELKYDDNRPNRVCFNCYTFLTGNVLPEDKEDRRRGILEVRATVLLFSKWVPGTHHILTLLGAEEKPAVVTPSLLSLPTATSPPSSSQTAGPATKSKQLLAAGCHPGSPTFPLCLHPVVLQPLWTVPVHIPNPCPTVPGGEES